MPVIVVLGLRDEGDTRGLEKGLKKAVASVEELDLSEDQVSCFFPKEFVTRSLYNEVVVLVEGLFVKEERTEEVRNKLAVSVGEAMKFHSSGVELIEVFVRPFDPAWGFWSSAEEEAK